MVQRSWMNRRAFSSLRSLYWAQILILDVCACGNNPLHAFQCPRNLLLCEQTFHGLATYHRNITPSHVFERGTVTVGRYTDAVFGVLYSAFQGCSWSRFYFNKNNVWPHKAHLVDDIWIVKIYAGWICQPDLQISTLWNGLRRAKYTGPENSVAEQVGPIASGTLKQRYFEN